MAGRAAIDANAYIALRMGDVEVVSLIGSYETVCLPVVVLGELLYGAGASGRVAENRQKVFEFAGNCEVLDVSPEVAETYAQLRLQLRSSGKPIPDNDLWIAAACMVADLPLITRDGHFSNLSGLQILSW